MSEALWLLAVLSPLRGQHHHSHFDVDRDREEGPEGFTGSCPVPRTKKSDALLRNCKEDQ